MKPTETLIHEHELILQVLEAAELEASAIRKSGSVDGERIGKFIDFFRNFADRCHHAKEEGHLFPALNAQGMPSDSGPVAVMLHEHDTGRSHIRAVEEALPKAGEGDEEALKRIRQELFGYVSLLRNHIAKENNVLFPMADRMLGSDDQEKIGAAFDRIEAEEMGEGTHERYHGLAKELIGRERRIA